MTQKVATRIQPLGNRVVLQRSESQKTQGGILLPDTAKEKPKQGRVLAVGPGKRDEKGRLQEMQLRVGDEVLFSSYAGIEVQVQDEEVLVLSEDEVLAVLGAGA